MNYSSFYNPSQIFGKKKSCCPVYTYKRCKDLPNKDHVTCRKERFIGSTDCWADPRIQGAAAQLE
jgi:hypothetical protein